MTTTINENKTKAICKKKHVNLNLSFSKISSIHTNFCSVKQYLLEYSPDILALFETNSSSSLFLVIFHSIERILGSKCMALVSIFRKISKRIVSSVSGLFLYVLLTFIIKLCYLSLLCLLFSFFSGKLLVRQNICQYRTVSLSLHLSANIFLYLANSTLIMSSDFIILMSDLFSIQTLNFSIA